MDKDVRTRQILKIIEALTIFANENKKEFVSIFLTGEKSPFKLIRSSTSS